MEITIHIPAMDKLADAILRAAQVAPIPAVQSPVAQVTPVPAAQTTPPVSPVTPPQAAPVPAPAPAQGNVVSMPTAAAPQAPVTPPPAVPVQQPGAFTYEQLQQAAGELVTQQRQGELVALLTKYGVPGMNQLPEAQYGAFATDLRALGAKI